MANLEGASVLEAQALIKATEAIPAHFDLKASLQERAKGTLSCFIFLNPLCMSVFAGPDPHFVPISIVAIDSFALPTPRNASLHRPGRRDPRHHPGQEPRHPVPEARHGALIMVLLITYVVALQQQPAASS